MTYVIYVQYIYIYIYIFFLENAPDDISMLMMFAFMKSTVFSDTEV